MIVTSAMARNYAKVLLDSDTEHFSAVQLRGFCIRIVAKKIQKGEFARVAFQQFCRNRKSRSGRGRWIAGRKASSQSENLYEGLAGASCRVFQSTPHTYTQL